MRLSSLPAGDLSLTPKSKTNPICSTQANFFSTSSIDPEKSTPAYPNLIRDWISPGEWWWSWRCLAIPAPTTLVGAGGQTTPRPPPFPCDVQSSPATRTQLRCGTDTSGLEQSLGGTWSHKDPLDPASSAQQDTRQREELYLLRNQTPSSSARSTACRPKQELV